MVKRPVPVRLFRGRPVKFVNLIKGKLVFVILLAFIFRVFHVNQIRKMLLRKGFDSSWQHYAVHFVENLLTAS